MNNDILLTLSDVDICRNENMILRNANFKLKRGEFVYVIGKVGSGKSTLLKSIYCEMPIKRGECTVFEYSVHKIKNKHVPHLRRKLGIVFQDFQLLTDRSVEKNLEFVLRATGWDQKGKIRDRISEVLQQVGMNNKGYKMPHELSGGEQQRIVIARALLNSPEIILADEPTGNLDPETGSQIVHLLHEICRNGTSVMMTTHNYTLVKSFPGRVIKCDNGQLIEVESGPVEIIANNDDL